MEEQKGSLLYVLFIFAGVASLSLGVFYFLTDDPEKYADKPQTEEKSEEEVTAPKEVNYSVNEVEFDANEAVLSLDNKQVKLTIKEEENSVELLLENLSLVKITGGSIDVYKLDNYLLVSSKENVSNTGVVGTKRNTNLYIVDKDGNKLKDYHLDSSDSGLTLYEEFTDGKLKIYGTRIDNNLLYPTDSSKGVDICDLDKLQSDGVSSTLTVSAEYELKYYDNKEFKLTLIENSKKTLVEYQQNYCSSNVTDEEENKEENQTEENNTLDNTDNKQEETKE